LLDWSIWSTSLSYEAGTHPEYYNGGRKADPEAVYNLCLILKKYVIKNKNCHKYNYNITLSATAFMYIELHVP
jgi:hypothetical protein